MHAFVFFVSVIFDLLKFICLLVCFFICLFFYL
jgi:hypothetical protein